MVVGVSHKIHGVLDSLLHQPLDLVLLALRQTHEAPGAARHGSLPGAGQLVVMLPRPLRHQVGVVGGGGVGDGPGAPAVQVAQVVGQHLGSVKVLRKQENFSSVTSSSSAVN